jgi:uncharacterized membrane protein
MLGLDSLTGVAKSNILDNIPLHSVPPISCLKIMVHLIPSRMNGISGLVSLMKYLVLQLLDVRHTDPSLYHNTPWSSFANLGDIFSLMLHFVSVTPLLSNDGH